MSKMCTRCIMDESDPDIVFDNNGVCNHCHQYDYNLEKYGYNEKNRDNFIKKIEEIKRYGKGKKYDCIIGISGGVDSSFLLHLAVTNGLRPLAVHVDAGWNTDTAVENIHRLCKKLNINLHTIVVDWATMMELQRAYMYSGLANLDIPQDHAFLAATYKYALKHNIKYMLNGGNMATESIMPKSWGYTWLDFKQIKAVFKIHARNGNLKLYPHFNVIPYYLIKRRIKRVNLLDSIPYSKKMAIDLLHSNYGWEYYGGKHFESRFTKFFQSHYLPEKFGYDKRRAHLSSMIVNGEISREDALIEMENDNFYLEETMIEDRDYVLKKLDIPLKDWEQIMKSKNKSAADYPSSVFVFKIIDYLKNLKGYKY